MLTEKRIRDARPGAKTSILWDGKVKGLGVRVTPAGAKAFILNYRVDGRARRATLGRVGEMSLHAARGRAGEELTAIRAGGADPLSRQRVAREAPTVAEGLDRFFNEFAPERLRIGRLKPKTIQDYRKVARAHLRPRLGRLKVEAVKRRDVERMVASLPPVARNRALAFTSRLWTLFQSWEWTETSPVRFIARSRETPRDRTLDGDEIAALAAALEAEHERSPAAVAAIRIAAMTGLRIGEVLAMRWEDIDFPGGRVLLPDTKTGRRWQTLASAALAALTAHPHIHGCEHVFTTTGRGPTTYKHVRTVLQRAAAAAGLSDVRLHDLRRTLLTRAAASGVGMYALRDLAGHSTTAMTSRYVREHGAATREAAEVAGATMRALMAGEAKAEVVLVRKVQKNAVGNK